jgi:4'-phosphopantetheinyl transferase
MAVPLISPSRDAFHVDLVRQDRRVPCCFSSFPVSEYPRHAERRRDLLSDQEMDYFESLPVERRRISYLLGRCAAKCALAPLLGEHDYRAISIEPGIFQQPVVVHRHAAGYDVSISHDGERAVAIAFAAGHPMGIDIEAFQARHHETLLHAVPAEERWLLQYRDCPGPELPLVLWTAREALSKAIRCGMMAPASTLSIESIDRCGTSRYESLFRNFPQYKALSWIAGGAVISIALPRRTALEFDPFRSWEISS